jgi:hypothetical protein
LAAKFYHHCTNNGLINNPVNGARLSIGNWSGQRQENHKSVNSTLLQTKTILNAKKTNIHIDNLPKT